MKLKRIRKGRSLVALALALSLLAACGTGGAVSVGEVGDPQPANQGGSEPTPATTPSPSGGGKDQIAVQAWFHRGDTLFATNRMVDSTTAVGRAAMETLLGGPIESETAAGLGTQIPAGTELLSLDIDGDIATVDLSGDYESGGGSASMFMRLAQTVYTLTQFPSVNGVSFRIDGTPVEVFSQEGIVLDGPVTRADYENLLPAIVVYRPYLGETLSGSATIAGTANVFEATVSMRILDASGHEIANGFTTATCGTGCRGDYETTMRFKVDSAQPGTVEVFESSAKDGSAINLVSIPVMLLP